MPLWHPPPPYPILALFTVVLAAGLLLVALLRWRHRRTCVWVWLLAMCVAFAVAAGGFTVASFQEYQWSYSYTVNVSTNGTSGQGIIVPVPGDASLLANLRLIGGQANWSFTDTPHGRGLFIRFTGHAEVGVYNSQFAPGGPSHNTTLTLANASTPYGPFGNWFYGSGQGTTVTFEVSENWAATGLWLEGGLRNELLVPGWHIYSVYVGAVP